MPTRKQPRKQPERSQKGRRDEEDEERRRSAVIEEIEADCACYQACDRAWRERAELECAEARRLRQADFAEWSRLLQRGYTYAGTEEEWWSRRHERAAEREAECVRAAAECERAAAAAKQAEAGRERRLKEYLCSQQPRRRRARTPAKSSAASAWEAAPRRSARLAKKAKGSSELEIDDFRSASALPVARRMELALEDASRSESPGSKEAVQRRAKVQTTERTGACQAGGARGRRRASSRGPEPETGWAPGGWTTSSTSGAGKKKKRKKKKKRVGESKSRPPDRKKKKGKRVGECKSRPPDKKRKKRRAGVYGCSTRGRRTRIAGRESKRGRRKRRRAGVYGCSTRGCQTGIAGRERQCGRRVDTRTRGAAVDDKGQRARAIDGSLNSQRPWKLRVVASSGGEECSGREASRERQAR